MTMIQEKKMKKRRRMREECWRHLKIQLRRKIIKRKAMMMTSMT